MRQGTQRVGQLQINEVFRGEGGSQFRLSGRLPSIRLRAQVLDLVGGCLGAQKAGH